MSSNWNPYPNILGHPNVQNTMYKTQETYFVYYIEIMANHGYNAENIMPLFTICKERNIIYYCFPAVTKT